MEGMLAYMAQDIEIWGPGNIRKAYIKEKMVFKTVGAKKFF